MYMGQNGIDGDIPSNINPRAFSTLNEKLSFMKNFIITIIKTIVRLIAPIIIPR